MHGTRRAARPSFARAKTSGGRAKPIILPSDLQKENRRKGTRERWRLGDLVATKGGGAILEGSLFGPDSVRFWLPKAKQGRSGSTLARPRVDACGPVDTPMFDTPAPGEGRKLVLFMLLLSSLSLSLSLLLLLLLSYGARRRRRRHGIRARLRIQAPQWRRWPQASPLSHKQNAYATNYVQHMM